MSRVPKSSPRPRPARRGSPAGAREGLFQAAFHNSPAMQSVMRAADATLVEVNETFLRKLGFARAEVIGKNARELDFWVEPQKLAGYRQELEQRGFVQGFETRLRARDGAILTVLLSTRPLDYQGVPHFLSAGVDITERKRAEAELQVAGERLRQSEERFSKAFRANPVTMAITRYQDGAFVAANESLLETTGYREEEVLGRTTRDLRLYAHPGEREEFIRRIDEQGFARNREIDIRAKDGRVRTLLASAERIEIDGVAHLLTVGIDITQKKQAEAELQHALAKERELGQLKSDFVSLVSHEFRTPLEIILSSADNLLRYHERLAPAKRDQLLHTIKKSVRRMSGMMEEVLLLGRLETDRMTFQPARFEWRAFCQRMCDEIEAATGRRCPIQLTLRDTPAEAVGDENVLRHIFTNLLSNAVKYSPPGGPVEFAVDRAGAEAVCRISDQGCGIPAADQKRLFEAFHRGSNVRQIPGTGLGLLIVHRCVELHAGEIGFTSEEGRGATFTVRLRLFAPAPPP